MKHKEMQKRELTNDLIFQQLFGKEGHEKYTRGLLEEILKMQIEDLTLDTNKRLQGEEMKDPKEIDKLILEAREELEKISADPEMRDLYDQREMELCDLITLSDESKVSREEGIEEGMRRGIRKEKEELIKSMLGNRYQQRRYM